MRDQRGQANPEYLGLVLLIALVVAGAVTLLATTGLGRSVVDAIQRALCVVTGGACDESAVVRPCVVSSEEQADGGSIDLAVLRVGSHESVLRERRADGTYAITLVNQGTFGLAIGAGGNFHWKWGSKSGAVGPELRAALLAESAHGRTWYAPDAAAAAALAQRVRLAALTERVEPTIETPPGYGMTAPNRALVRAPPPAVEYRERGPALSLDVRRLGRDLHVAADDVYGERIESATGRRTLYVRRSAAGRGALSLAKVGASGQGEVEERYGITYDRSGRPVDLEVLSALDVKGAVQLPPKLAAIAGLLHIPANGARHVETEQRLDLTSADAAPLAMRALAGDEAAVAELRGRLDRDGSTSVRSYTDRNEERSMGGEASVGVTVGGEAGRTDRFTKLDAARVRTGAGPWRLDTACGASAA